MARGTYPKRFIIEKVASIPATPTYARTIHYDFSKLYTLAINL